MTNLILESALRTMAVAALAALLLALFRVRSSSVKLAVWRLVLYAGLLMPLTSFLKLPTVPPPAPVARVFTRAATQVTFHSSPVKPTSAQPIDWQALALRAYALIAGLLLLRAALGLLKLRGLAASPTPFPDVYETKLLNVPITFGIIQPRILLPADWTDWDDATLEAVLAHEQSHIAQRDFLTQCLSKLNRALYWANPLAWWLDRHLAVLAEEVSDDAALHRIPERPAYAAMLLGFASRRTPLALAGGVAMARQANVAKRIDRILDESRLLSRPLPAIARIGLASVALVTALLIGAFKMSTVAAAQTNPPAPPASPRQTITVNKGTIVLKTGEHNRSRWCLMHRDGRSMNGPNSWEYMHSFFDKTNGKDFLWFNVDGKEYLIDDPKLIAEIDTWFEPMEELGRQQGELGEQMGKLGEEMEKLGEQMSKVKVEMPDISEELRQIDKLKAELLNSPQLEAQAKKLAAEAAKMSKQISLDELSHLQERIGELQTKLGEAQELAGEKQEKIGELQSELGEKQSELGERQSELGEKQSKIFEEAERKLDRLIEKSLKEGLAKPVR